MRVLLTSCLLLVTATVAAAPVHHLDFLPPEIPWEGASEALMLAPDHEWATPFEVSGGDRSPSYDETIAWVQKLVEAAPQLTMVSLGESPEGRPIVAVIASSEGAFDAEAVRRSDRPTLLAHSGIHSGEIDGKDAGLMLLRDMTVTGTRGELLDLANFVFVPIFSVDAHERASERSRMNQRGPVVSGWRTTARNLNLNRDYAKADAVEMRHMLRALEAFDPDLYLDLHVTDGADYAYDLTYGFNRAHGWSPHIATWLDDVYRPSIDQALKDMGHIPGPLIFAIDNKEIEKGMYEWTAGPRFSNGYGDARHLATVLLENHSLKPYRQRVLGTYVFLEANLRTLARGIDALREATRADRAARPDSVHLGYAQSQGPIGTIDFEATRGGSYASEITGNDIPQWSGETYTVEIPIFGNKDRTHFVTRPDAYWIPAAWSNLGEILDLHGIEYERLTTPRRVEVEQYRLPEAKIEEAPFEGRVRVRPGEIRGERTTVDLRPGALRVSTDQARATLAMLLLEPASEDSFFQWGMMLEILQRTEYFEDYVMEPMARRMMEEDPALRAAFESRLAEDPEFAGNPRARLDFFYERSEYYDREYLLYPIVREVE